MIQLLDQGSNQGIHLRKIPHEPAGIERAPHDDRDAVIVPVQIPASMSFRDQRQMVSRFEAIGPANSGL
jgi:hypothetical protein